MRVSPIYRHLKKFLEPQRVPYNSRIIQNSLHNSMYKPRYKNIQEIPRILQKVLDSSYVFHHSVEMCGYLQASLEPSTLFPLMTQCRWLQKSSKTSCPLYNTYGEGHLEESCDSKLKSSNLIQVEKPLPLFSIMFLKFPPPLLLKDRRTLNPLQTNTDLPSSTCHPRQHFIF